MVFYLGGAAGLAIDLQHWVSERVGVRAGFEVSLGQLGQVGDTENPYFRSTLLLEGSLSSTVGLSYRFW